MVRWCAISSFGIIGPYFFEDEREKVLTVKRSRYVHMLESFLGPELARHSVTEEKFFQQDGATSHTTRDSMAAVRNLFRNRVISPDMGTSHGQPGHPIFQQVISFSGGIWNLKSSKLQHSSGVETLNSARSQTNSCGDASKSNGWRLHETYRVPRAEWWPSEWCYFRKVGLLFSAC